MPPIYSRDTAWQWSEHKVLQLAAALAYYSIFSIASLLVLVIALLHLPLGRRRRADLALGLLHLSHPAHRRMLHSSLARIARRRFETVTKATRRPSTRRDESV
jgi:uncharacterized BrkB/YihY/UPF0761 family membrane protein